jgi:uncharacterized RDD family membrane protein YckC
MEETGWYYFRDGGSFGPESAKRLLELLEKGAIQRRTPVWREDRQQQPLEVALGLPEPPPLPESESASSDLRNTIQARPAPPPFAGDYYDDDAHPWRRYFARMLDTTVGAGVVFFLIGLILGALDQNAADAFTTALEKPELRIVQTILTCAIAIPVNALLIGLTGSSLGKWIFGIKVLRDDGQVLGFAAALRREVYIFIRGLGLAIPIVTLITLINAFRRLKDEGETSWDSEMYLKVLQRPDTPGQMIANLFGVILWIGLIVGLMAL